MSKPLKKLIYLVIGLIVIGLIFLLYLLIVVSMPNSDSDQAVFFQIESGQGVNEISQQLKNYQLIKNTFAFETYLWIKRMESSLKAGDYQLAKNLTIKEVTEALVGGPNSNERTIQIIEGWQAAEIAEYLEEEEVVEADDFMDAASVTDSRQIIPNKTYDWLTDRTAGADLEGFLFPDTYRVFKTSDSVDIITKMLDNFDSKMTTTLKQEISNQGKTIFEIVILASVLEKELRTDADRKMAADLFYRRIEAGIPMQSDATVNYVTGKSLLQPSYADTRLESPYNTYLNRGLPPGPICNPSLSSIKAVIYPEPNEYWYYLNKPDGTTVFSKTLEEHNNNKVRYLSD